MYFRECERLVQQHPDLAQVFERLDAQLRAMGTPGVIRPDDLASFLSTDPNKVRSALHLLAQEGLLLRSEMIECTHCDMAAPRSDYQEAMDEEDEYRCTSCDRLLTDRTIRAITAYQRGEKWQEVSNNIGGGSRDAGLREAPSVTTETALKVPRTMGSDAAVRALLSLKGKKGWTMEELAGHLGTTARTLQRLMKRRTVRSSVFRAMAQWLGVTPEALLSGHVPDAK